MEWWISSLLALRNLRQHHFACPSIFNNVSTTLALKNWTHQISNKQCLIFLMWLILPLVLERPKTEMLLSWNSSRLTQNHLIGEDIMPERTVRKPSLQSQRPHSSLVHCGICHHHIQIKCRPLWRTWIKPCRVLGWSAQFWPLTCSYTL